MTDDAWLAIHEGDARAVLAALPPASVHAVVTSPPYWGLRDYGIPPTTWGGDPGHDHAWSDPLARDGRGGQAQANVGKLRWQHAVNGDGRLEERQHVRAPAPTAGEICACGAWRGTLGLEPTPELYVEHLLEVFREVRRVLRPDGTAWLNLGDSFAAKARGSDAGWDRSRLNNPGYVQKAQAASLRSNGERHRGKASGLKEKDLVGIPWRVAFALQADGWHLRMDVVWAKPNPMPESVE